MNELAILKIDCPDGVGLLARFTGFVAERGGNFVEVNQYTDTLSGWFFARLAFEPGPSGLELFRAEFAEVAETFSAAWTLRLSSKKIRTAILVSKEDHCLADLLWRWRSQELQLDLPLVIGNHETCRHQVERESIPFLHLPISEATREADFQKLAKTLREAEIEFVILARFMQILPPWFCEEFSGRVMNIHHSFLPAFAGAFPYRRAYERGVKLIGATCHYATEELDAGPIIEQEVVRVEHYHEPDDLKRLGRDCEKIALARGVRYHLEDRVLLHGSRAVVFRD